jgi:hypothetical protein
VSGQEGKNIFSRQLFEAFSGIESTFNSRTNETTSLEVLSVAHLFSIINIPIYFERWVTFECANARTAIPKKV